MLVLLPPSEGKTAPDDGPPLDLAALSLPGLTGARTEVLTTLAQVSGRPDALEVLRAPAGARDEVAAQQRLSELPTARADRVFTGVLFDRAGIADLTGEARARADRDVLVMSGAFGALSPADPIPAYRLGMTATLPGLDGLGAFWRGPMAAELDARAEGELVVDCRSGGYRAMWKVPPAADDVEVGAVTVRDGRRSVVSHDAKWFRGLLVGHLLRREAPEPASAEELAGAARELVGTVREAAAAPRKGVERTTWTLTDVELEPPARNGGAAELTLVLTQRP
ncbi:YaaA family protein [Georgenia sp. Z1344]|uniref:YaaA family protein n=1 Tax=Georgenia sp. Z1344 TaxID=3416706 RepID=UPI003CF039C5